MLSLKLNWSKSVVFFVVINNINPDCMSDVFKYFSNVSEKPNKILIINVISVNKCT